MTWFERIKGFYERGFWTLEMVQDGVRVGKITPQEYEVITGEEYPH